MFLYNVSDVLYFAETGSWLISRKVRRKRIRKKYIFPYQVLYGRQQCSCPWASDVKVFSSRHRILQNTTVPERLAHGTVLDSEAHSLFVCLRHVIERNSIIMLVQLNMLGWHRTVFHLFNALWTKTIKMFLQRSLLHRYKANIFNFIEFLSFLGIIRWIFLTKLSRTTRISLIICMLWMGH